MLLKRRETGNGERGTGNGKRETGNGGAIRKRLPIQLRFTRHFFFLFPKSTRRAGEKAGIQIFVTEVKAKKKRRKKRKHDFLFHIYSLKRLFDSRLVLSNLVVHGFVILSHRHPIIGGQKSAERKKPIIQTFPLNGQKGNYVPSAEHVEERRGLAEKLELLSKRWIG